MVDWTSSTPDASAAERAAGYLLARIPGSPDVLKEVAIADMVFKNAAGDVGIGTAIPAAKLEVARTDSAAGIRVTVGQGAYSGTVALFGVSGQTNGYYITKDASNNILHIWDGTGGAERMRIESIGTLRPGADNAQNLGSASFRWATVFAGTGTINTSDEREKTEIGDIPDAWLDAWGDVQWQRFKFKDRSRWHVGLVAQRVHAAFDARGLDAFEIGLCCFDAWEESREAITETVEGTRKVPKTAMLRVEGTPDDKPLFEPVTIEVEEVFSETIDTGETRVVQEAGDRWGLRYDECFAIEAAWQRRELARMAERLAALETAEQYGDAK